MYSSLEILPLIAVPPLISWIVIRLAHTFHRGWIVYVGFGTVIVTCVAFALLARWMRDRAAQRAAGEQRTIEALYPSCRVTRLASGKWFLTDRETGREYCGARYGEHDA